MIFCASRPACRAPWRLVLPQGGGARRAPRSNGERQVDACDEYPPLCGCTPLLSPTIVADRMWGMQTDPAGGRILIDGIDICSIGLHDLRSRIVSVPCLSDGALPMRRLTTLCRRSSRRMRPSSRAPSATTWIRSVSAPLHADVRVLMNLSILQTSTRTPNASMFSTACTS